MASMGLPGPWIDVLADVSNARLFLRGHAWLDVASARAEAGDEEGAGRALDGMWKAGATCGSCLPGDEDCSRAALLEVRAGRPYAAFRWLVRQRRLREPRLRVAFDEAGEKQLRRVDDSAPEAAVDPGALAEVLCACAGIARGTGERGDAPPVPTEEEDAGLHAAIKCFLRSAVTAGIAARDVGVGKDDARRLWDDRQARREKKAAAGEEAEEEDGDGDDEAMGPPEFFRCRVPGGGELFPGAADARIRAAWLGARPSMRASVDRLPGGPAASEHDDEVSLAREGHEEAVQRHRDLVDAAQGLQVCWEAVFGDELDVVGLSRGVLFEAEGQDQPEPERAEAKEADEDTAKESS